MFALKEKSLGHQLQEGPKKIFAGHEQTNDMINLFITWNPSPEIFSLGSFSLKYYSLAFMLGFAVSYFILLRNFEQKSLTTPLLDKLTIYVFIGTLAGARLGHCLFYDFAYFSKHPLEIFLPVTFEPHFQFTGFQGLASHGGGIGIIIGLWLFSRRFHISLWYLLDQVAIVVPLAGAFIRLGNLMNSEIIGKPTGLPWAFVFKYVDNIPRHPSQLYEVFGYLLTFALLYSLAKKNPRHPGYYFGFLVTILFSFRFFIEFTKEIQSSFESNLPIDMGQLLSIPFVLIGIWIMVNMRKRSTIPLPPMNKLDLS